MKNNMNRMNNGHSFFNYAYFSFFGGFYFAASRRRVRA